MQMPSARNGNANDVIRYAFVNKMQKVEYKNSTFFIILKLSIGEIMIENFTLKSYDNFAKHDDIVRNIDNNAEVAEKALRPLATKYALSMNNNSYKTGNTWELINASLELDPYKPYLNIFDRPFKHDYLEKEHAWYMSMDRSIIGWMDDIKIWNFCASKDEKKEINSNYGWCVFSEENGSQYENCLKKLVDDVNTREAMMIYTRPSIHHDAVENGKHDFICTNYAHLFIREGALYYIACQRSCDIVTGMSFDFPWHCFVYQMMFEELKKTYPDLKVGSIMYNIDSLHIYERHEELLKNYAIKCGYLKEN